MAGVAAAVAVAGVATAAAGAITARQTQKSNEKLAKKSELNEKNRRERAAQELEEATKRYNEIRSERPSLSVKEFLTERANELGGDEARQFLDTIRNIKQEDFERAQAVADAASQGNINTFDVILDQVSGGQSAEILRRRNENALQTNELDAFNRALQLRSTAIPAGTVRQDSQGRFVEGQRADKQVFQLAFETQEALRDKEFSKLTAIIEDDRAIAERQQQKALDFLSQQDATSFLQSNVLGAAARRDEFQIRDEQTQLDNIRQFQAAAFTDQTKQPTFHSTGPSEQLISSGFDLALKGVSLAAGSGGK